MPKTSVVQQVADELFASILASPKRQRRLYSRTFWDKFGIRVRSRERIEQVFTCLEQRGILISADKADFGKEDRDDWIVLTHVQPELRPTPRAHEHDAPCASPTPTASWFELMARRTFESEREVENYFVIPLMEQLGYVEDDLAIGYPVEMFEGVRKVTKEADCVVFNGTDRSREAALLVVEAKKSNRPLTDDVAGQARGYAVWLTTPYYLVTNGCDIRVFIFRGGLSPDAQLFSLSRDALAEHWGQLYACLNRGAVLDYKKRVLESLGGANISITPASGMTQRPEPAAPQRDEQQGAWPFAVE